MNVPDRIAELVNVFAFDLVEAASGLLASVFNTLASVFTGVPRYRNS